MASRISGDLQIQADWNETVTTNKSYIQNKPVLGDAASTNVTTAVDTSSNLPTSNAVKTYVDTAIQENITDVLNASY